MSKPITRDTGFPTKMGKWNVKGTPLRALPDKFLEWYAEEGQFDDWREAASREITLRAQGDNGKPDTQAAELGGKALLDNLIVAFAYIEQSLNRLGFDTSSPAATEAIQKLAVTGSIAASDRGIDLRAAVGRLIASGGKSGPGKGNPAPPADEDDSDLPF